MSNIPLSREEEEIREGLLNQESVITTADPEMVCIVASSKQRLKSIDVYRGLTMCGMIMVNDQGDTPIWPLNESEWNGISTADLVFPSFLFIMGFAVPLAIR